MKKQPKIWICGQVAASGQLANMTDLVKTFSYFDGAIWTVNYAADGQDDGTAALIQETIKTHNLLGDVLKTRWVNIHSIGMTMFLQCGLIEEGDWLLVVDAQELPKEPWLKGMRSQVENFENDNITAMFWGRPYFFKFNNQMVYEGSTHCWPKPFCGGKILSVQDESKVVYENDCVHFGDFLVNRKNFDDTMLLHACKYFWVYDLTNEAHNQYGKFGNEVIKFHEQNRQAFRRYCKHKLGIPLTLEGLEAYFRAGQYDETFVEYVELENVFKDFFRRVVLGQPREDILKKRYNWSFKYYLEHKSIDQPFCQFVGTRNRYNEKLGLPQE